MSPFFSVIIPTLNEEQYLPVVLTCLSKQKEKNFEVIIVDANSTDDTQKVATQFSSSVPLHFLQVDKKNVAYQRNHGAQHAQGSYLIFLDADSKISSTFTRKAKKVITQKYGLIFMPYVFPDDKTSLDVQFIFNFINFLIEVSQATGKPFSSGGSMIFDKEFFKKIGGFNVSLPFGEDHNLIQKALQWGVKAKFVESLKIIVSLRRMRREGRLKMFYKYILATAYILFKGKITKRIYEYEMGGKPYKRRLSTRNYTFKDYMAKVNVYFKQIFAGE